MSDLIDRQTVIDMLQSQAYDDWNQGASTTWANAFSECAEMIRNLPSAEPERKRGKWLDDYGNEKKDGYGADCSVCGGYSEYLTDYCGDCGAYMKGEEKMNEGLKTDVIDYGEEVFDKVTKYRGKVTGYVHYFGRKPGQYLVESIDTTGRPIEDWIEEGRVERVRKG